MIGFKPTGGTTAALVDITRAINRSIVQGSGKEPTLFTICIINLQPIGLTNRITKYADDSSLLVPEKCDIISSRVCMQRLPGGAISAQQKEQLFVKATRWNIV